MARRRFQRGSLKLVGDRWQLRWREGYKLLSTGKRARIECKEFIGTLRDYPTRRLALRFCERRLQHVNNPDYREKPSISFERFINDERTGWKALVMSQHKPSTRSSERSVLLNHLVPFFGPMKLSEINGQAVQGFIADSRSAPKTVRNHISLLQEVWTTARAWGYVSHDPLAALSMPVVHRKPRFKFTLDEATAILAEVPDKFRHVFWLEAETHVRIGELCGLGVDDLDLERCLIAVTRSSWQGKLQSPKSANSIRRFEISPQLCEELKRRMAVWEPNPARLLICTSNGTPYNENWMRKRVLKPVMQKLGIGIGVRAGFHGFRHLGGTLMDQLAVPAAVRQQKMGHADFDTTMGYTQGVSEDGRRLAAALGMLLSVPGTEVRSVM